MLSFLFFFSFGSMGLTSGKNNSISYEAHFGSQAQSLFCSSNKFTLLALFFGICFTAQIALKGEIF
jgi:hypothetical protein